MSALGTMYDLLRSNWTHFIKHEIFKQNKNPIKIHSSHSFLSGRYNHNATLKIQKLTEFLFNELEYNRKL